VSVVFGIVVVARLLQWEGEMVGGSVSAGMLTLSTARLMCCGGSAMVVMGLC